MTDSPILHATTILHATRATAHVALEMTCSISQWVQYLQSIALMSTTTVTRKNSTNQKYCMSKFACRDQRLFLYY